MNGSTDAATIGQSSHNLITYGLLRLPQNSIGSEVTKIGFLRAHAGCLIAVQQHFSLGKCLAQFRHYLLVYGIDHFLNRFISSQTSRAGYFSGNFIIVNRVQTCRRLDGHLVILDGLVHEHIADVGEGRAGGDDVQSYAVHFITAVQDGMAVTVDEEVDAGDIFHDINGTIRFALVINAQMPDADDQLAALGAKLINLCLSDGIQLFALRHCDALDLIRMRLGHSFGSNETKQTNLHAALFHNRIGMEEKLLVRGTDDVGTKHGEIRFAQILLQIVRTPVKLMVAEGRKVIARFIHEGNSLLAVVHVHNGHTLTEVACVNEQNFRALRF